MATNALPAVLRMSMGSREQSWGMGLSRQSSNLTHTTTHTTSQPYTIYLWIYKEPNSIFLLNSERMDFHTLRDYVEKSFSIEGDSYTLASLIPSVAYPIPLFKANSEMHRGLIICLPTVDITIQLHYKNQDAVAVTVNPVQTVKELKQIIYDQKGLPVNLQEIVYNGKVMENRKLFIDYKLAEGSNVELVLQPEQSFAVHINSFWGAKYTVEINSYSNCEDVLNKVFRKTLAKPAYREQILKFKSMYKGLIIIEYDEQVLDKKKSVHWYGVSADKTLNVTLVSEKRGDVSRKIVVEDDRGGILDLYSAGYDTWFIIALKIHGKTNIPIDTMKLLFNDRPVDLQCNIGILKMADESINVNLFQLPPPSSLMGKITVSLTTPAGLTEQVQCGPRESVKDVKKRLESVGVENAQMYDIHYKNVRLPSHTKLFEYKLVASEHCSMELKLHEFPVYVHYEDIIIKLSANPDMTVAQLLGRVEERVGCSTITSRIIHAGEDLYMYEHLPLKDTTVHLNCNLHIVKYNSNSIIQLHTEHEVITLPNKSTFDATVSDKLLQSGINVSSFSDSYKWFLKWRFPAKIKLMKDFRSQSIVGNPPLGSRTPVRINSRMSKKDSLMKSTTAHNSSHKRNICQPNSGTHNHHHSTSDQQPTFPEINRSSSRTTAYQSRPHYSSQENIPKPKPALKTYSKSQELLTANIFQNMQSSKKKATVRFDENPQVSHNQSLPVFPWHSARKAPMYSQDVFMARKSRQQQNLDENHQRFSRRRSSDRADNKATVAVKFQMNV